MKLLRSKISRVALCAILASTFFSAAAAQSTDQQFPTPVTTNEINGSIRARDIGDPRLTSYFYLFEGGQGDIFINVVTRNFSGDIDVFTADGLKPMTKMVIYADSGISETGRLVYLRKAERLMLRVEGRSPNDDPASFRIKFAGSFIALAEQKTENAPSITPTEQIDGSGVRVNSVGTIIASSPRPKLTKKTPDVVKETVTAVEDKITKSDQTSSVTEPLPSNQTDIDTKDKTVFENEAAKVTVEPVAKPPTRRKRASRAPKPPLKVVEKRPDPLASIRLVIQLKDGNVIERPMSEILKFSVDRGMLTVITKDGNITRHSILDVAKVTIQ